MIDDRDRVLHEIADMLDRERIIDDQAAVVLAQLWMSAGFARVLGSSIEQAFEFVRCSDDILTAIDEVGGLDAIEGSLTAKVYLEVADFANGLIDLMVASKA